MSLPSALLSSLVAFGTQWPIIDLPYPDVDRLGAGAAVPSVAIQVKEAVNRYARGRAVPSSPAERKPEISQLRIDGNRASAPVSAQRGGDVARELLQSAAVGGGDTLRVA